MLPLAAKHPEGQEVNAFHHGALHQHFGNAGSAAKIAIDLKGRMRIKEIIVGTASSALWSP